MRWPWRRGERSAADWVAEGSPLPDEARRAEGLAFELAQVLGIQNRRAPKPWPERVAMVERILSGPRWSEAGYRWADGQVVDPAGAVVVTVSEDPATGGHVIERYEDGTLVERNRFDEHGRVAPGHEADPRRS